jgi:hypothetical protein
MLIRADSCFECGKDWLHGKTLSSLRPACMRMLFGGPFSLCNPFNPTISNRHINIRVFELGMGCSMKPKWMHSLMVPRMQLQSPTGLVGAGSSCIRGLCALVQLHPSKMQQAGFTRNMYSDRLLPITGPPGHI